jgi:hypothetical protein
MNIIRWTAGEHYSMTKNTVYNGNASHNLLFTSNFSRQSQRITTRVVQGVWEQSWARWTHKSARRFGRRWWCHVFKRVEIIFKRGIMIILVQSRTQSRGHRILHHAWLQHRVSEIVGSLNTRKKSHVQSIRYPIYKLAETRKKAWEGKEWTSNFIVLR